jgi:hypothetical protein
LQVKKPYAVEQRFLASGVRLNGINAVRKMQVKNLSNIASQDRVSYTMAQPGGHGLGMGQTAQHFVAKCKIINSVIAIINLINKCLFSTTLLWYWYLICSWEGFLSPEQNIGKMTAVMR